MTGKDLRENQLVQFQDQGVALHLSNSWSSHNILKLYLAGMANVWEFGKGLVLSIPDNAWKDGSGGMMIVPPQMESPIHKRQREDTLEPDAGGGGTSRTSECQQLNERGFQKVLQCICRGNSTDSSVSVGALRGAAC